jgi:hypothetical protein
MKVNGRALPDTPLWALRALLGDARVDEMSALAATLYQEHDLSVEELICLADHFRLFAEVESWKEGGAWELPGEDSA